MNRTVRAAALVGLALAAASCEASYPAAPTPASPIALQVHYTRATGLANVGSLHQFTAYVLDSDGAYDNVTAEVSWSSSDPSVLRPLSSPGAFTAASSGAAEVVARWREFTSSAWIVVTRFDRQAFPVLSVTVGDPRETGRRANAIATLRHTATSSEVVTDRATWASSDTRVVTVDRGEVTAVSPGTAYIAASYDGMTATYGLSVQPRR